MRLSSLLNPKILRNRTSLVSRGVEVIRLALLSALFVGALTSTASAQGGAGWLSDRDRTEGPGIRVGDLELHPGFGVELGYDSNVFYSASNATDAAILRFTPHFNVSTLGAERQEEGESSDEDEERHPPAVNFRAGLSGSYYVYFSDEVRDNFSVDADIRLTVLPERPFSFTVYETFGRSVRPFTETAPDPDGGLLDYARIHNEAGLQLDFGTDGGVFKANVGYGFEIDLFEGEAFDYANNLTHRIDAGAAWKFFPNTAFLYDFQLQFGDYINTDEPSAVLRPSSTRLRSRLGINGSITKTISVTAMVGYHAGFYTVGDEVESVAAQAELRWLASTTTRLSLGYDGDYYPAFSGQFARRDRGYVGIQTMIAGSFLLGAEASAAYITFGPQLDEGGAPLGVGGTTDRSDVMLQASLFGEYRFTDWFGVNVNLAYTGNFTDFQYNRNIDMMVIPDAAEFQKFEAWLGVRVFY